MERRAVRRSIGGMKTLLAAVAAALAVAATASAALPPKELVGKWTRTVTASDVQRAHSTKIIPGTTWTLVIAQHESRVSTAGGAPMKGNVVPSNATQVNIELGAQKPNLYDWRRSGKKLTLHARVDQVADRAAVLSGVWKKRP